MSLLSRIAGHGNGRPTPQTNDLRVVGTNNSALETPLVRIAIYPGAVAYDEGGPLVAADGAPISATGPGEWSQVYAAGRM